MRYRKITKDNIHDHILVCLSSSPSNAKIIGTAAMMAKAFRAEFTALYVETPEEELMVEADKRRLAENIEYAKECGAYLLDNKITKLLDKRKKLINKNRQKPLHQSILFLEL